MTQNEQPNSLSNVYVSWGYDGAAASGAGKAFDDDGKIELHVVSDNEFWSLFRDVRTCGRGTFAKVKEVEHSIDLWTILEEDVALGAQTPIERLKPEHELDHLNGVLIVDHAALAAQLAQPERERRVHRQPARPRLVGLQYHGQVEGCEAVGQPVRLCCGFAAALARRLRSAPPRRRRGVDRGV